MSDNNNDLYGLGSITRFGEIEEERERMAAFGSESSAISDAASIIAAEFRRRSSASTIVSGGVIRERIASHPLFPKLLGAYLDCRKVGAPPEIANELEEIRRDNGEPLVGAVTSDPELDDFMETYCQILVKYKSDLTRPFDEATTFLSEMQAQLNDLISNSSASTSYVSGVGDSSDEENENEIDCALDIPCHVIDRELKDKLMSKYSGQISSLRREFSKKKKKGKLPKEARQVLFDWWILHYRWPYPTEGDKIELGEATGLDQKQINNWFINQRKRHWKPPENMHVAFMDSHSLL